MTRQPEPLQGILPMRPQTAGLAVVPLLLLSLALPSRAATPAPGPGGILPAAPYYLSPCVDVNNDRVEDYLLSLSDPVGDLYVIFDDTAWNATTRRAQVQAILNSPPISSASIVYVGEYSPYVFLDDLDFGEPRAVPPKLADILALPGVIGVRAYQRFILTTMTAGTVMEPRPWDGIRPVDEAPEGMSAWESTLSPSGGDDGRPLGADPQAIAPLPAAHSTLVYFVDSGIDGDDAYWGIDAPNEDPLLPERGQDPKDISALKHGTFVKGAAFQTAHALLPGVPPSAIRYADVRVALGLNGETTTLELTRAFDAIVSHIKHEAAQGRTPRVVINVSYDTDGGIANHDIIYPKAEGRVSPLGRHLVGDLNAPITPAPGAPLDLSPLDPCAIDLFDSAYRILGAAHGATIVVGAGNDGQRASYVINPVGRSIHTTIVATATEPRTGRPEAYSCFGTAPGGLGQNGHPDLAAAGTMKVKGFRYQLQGTSVSTAIVSGVAASTLHRNPTLSPAALLSGLIGQGFRIPAVGNRWYGDARVKTAADGRGPAPADTLGRPGGWLAVGADRIRLDLPADARLSVQLFNVAGRLVRTLHDGPLPAGRHEFVLDGRDPAGAPLAAGLYFVRVSRPGGSQVAKLLLRR